MKRIYTVTVINKDLEAINTYECATKKEVKNLVNAYNFPSAYTVAKNDKLVKRLSSKKGLEILANNEKDFF